MDNITAKTQLDVVIKKARSHFYKPIQIAEILHRDRVEGDIDLGNLDSYRSHSQRWRNEISLRFVGRKSSSTSRFHDNLFDPNATPPEVLEKLGEINRSNNGAVEAYIYTAFREKLSQISSGLSLVLQSDKTSFRLREFTESFTLRPGLKRSIDKIFEIVVYALFSTLLNFLDVKIGVHIDNINTTLLQEFSDFTEKVLGVSEETPIRFQKAKLFRAGVTNAADRGLDMWGNFGVAIQIKHISLTPDKVEDITSEISADRIIVVCKECEREVLVSVLKQFGSVHRLQSVVTEEELEIWYEKALRGESAELIGDKVLQTLANEIEVEFPSVTSEFDDFFKERGYDSLSPVDLLEAWNMTG